MTIPVGEGLHTVSADPGDSDPWLVLVVDDEPAVHEVTRMLLARFLFEGRPLELQHAVSAAGAREFLSAHPQTALVILDVVMETDDAGLNLCHYIRETLGNRDVQIVLRTGQPGHAPERTVVRDYDINGYYLKTELTAQKLQSMVICALRAWTNAGRLRRASAARAPTTRTYSGQAEEVVGSLGSSIDNNHLQLSWSPMVGLDDGRLRGVEVQASWRTRTGDEISGNALETLAEGEGLARQLGHWLLHKACEDVAQWGNLGGERFRLNVNLPAALLVGDELLAAVERQLERQWFQPRRLALEFTEPGIMRDPHASATIVRRLRELGISVIVDEFGTGLASLAQIRQLEPDGLKIAGSIVGRIDADPEAAAIVRTAIALAHTQGIATLADGVCNQSQWEFLRWEECDAAQGPFVGAPLQAVALRALLAEDKWGTTHVAQEPLH